MRLKAYTRLGDPNPIVADVTVVVVEDAEGVPIAVACEIADGAIEACTAKDPEFNRTLRVLGIDKLVIAESIDAGLKTPDNLPLIFGGDT